MAISARERKSLGWLAALVVGAFVLVGQCSLTDDSSTTGSTGAAPTPTLVPPALEDDLEPDTEPDEAEWAETEAEPPPPPPREPPAEAVAASRSGATVPAARGALPFLEIKGRAPKTGYSRDEFGQAWSDDVSVEFGRNGCDTRNDILARDLEEIVYRPGTHDCVVLSGVLHDPFTTERIEFTRGPDTSRDVQIDHVVSLSDAWQKGAQQMSEDERRNFANDPLNLLAVQGAANNAKGDGDVATWLPPNRAFRCEFVSIHVLVKERYGLWVTPAEHEAMERILSGC